MRAVSLPESGRLPETWRKRSTMASLQRNPAYWVLSMLGVCTTVCTLK